LEKVRIAVAGAGLIGLRHIEETVASHNCNLAAIIDPRPKAAEVAQKYGVPLYQSLQPSRKRSLSSALRQIEHFGKVIRGEEAPLVTGRDGLQNLRVVDAISEAAKTGKAVEIQLN